MPIDDLTALGDALRAARKEKNLTQEQLADESHVSTKQIADIEKASQEKSFLFDFESIGKGGSSFTGLAYVPGSLAGRSRTE